MERVLKSSGRLKRGTVALSVCAAALMLLGHRPVPAFGAPEDAAIKSAIDRGVGYLKTVGARLGGGEASLVALAMLKGGTAKNDPTITRAVSGAKGRVNGESYTPSNHLQRVYGAGIDLMLLANADAKKHKAEIGAIAKYLISVQAPAGFWDYPPPRAPVGDTSMTQYALLGLWAAQRSGVDVPQAVWEGAARWLMKTQFKGGGFTYRPGARDYPGVHHSMTAAGSASVLIARLHLFPHGKLADAKKPAGPKFGVLEEVNIDADQSKTGAKGAPGKSSVPLDNLNSSFRRATGWLTNNYQIANVTHYPLYYLYALERTAALADIDKLGSHDWYYDGARLLISTQKGDGSWTGKGHGIDKQVGTSFALLFLTKATSQALGKGGGPTYGTGLMAANKGNLPVPGEVRGSDGKPVESKKIEPLDKVLAELARSAGVKKDIVKPAVVDAAVTAMVAAVQRGDTKALFANKEMMLKLVDHSNVDVRRVALFGLGRTGDFQVAKVLIEALEDRNIDVVVEARNALCWVSRRPRGFGLPNTPLEGVDEDASPQQKKAALVKWHREVVRRWQGWYFKVRPYAERDTVQEIGAQQ